MVAASTHATHVPRGATTDDRPNVTGRFHWNATCDDLRVSKRVALLLLAACAPTTPWGRATVAAPTIDARTIEIAASRSRFEPNQLAVRLGEVVRLRFTRTTGNSCAREVMVSLDGEHQIRRELPVGIPVDIVLRFERPGELGFSCGMAMLGGSIDVRAPTP